MGGQGYRPVGRQLKSPGERRQVPGATVDDEGAPGQVLRTEWRTEHQGADPYKPGTETSPPPHAGFVSWSFLLGRGVPEVLNFLFNVAPRPGNQQSFS